MNFLYPSFLFGFFALAIPILIHLFDFRRTKKVYFSNTRLLNQVKESTRSFYNLKHILILLSRLLFIAALVFAFAQPYIAPKGQKALNANKVGIFIDNSNSMSNRVGRDENGLSVAIETAKELINLYPSGTEFILQTAYNESSVLLYSGKQETIKNIENIKFSNNHRSLTEILTNFNETYTGAKPSEVVLISDFQKATLLPESLKVDSSIHYILAPIVYESLNNIVIDSAYISNPLELDKTKTNLVVRVRNYGSQERKDVPVRLFLGERQLSVTSISIPALSYIEMDFAIGQDLNSDQAGYIIVEDYPLSFDNKLFFSFKTIEKVNIVQIVEGNTGNYLAAVYANDALFKLSTIPSSNINYNALEEADVIILNQLSEIENTLAQRVRNLHTKGTGLLIIPALEPVISSYESLIPGISSGLSVDSKLVLQSPDFNRPFFSNIVEREDENLRMPESKAVISWGSDRNALLKFVDGRPFLSEREKGKFLLASPLDEEYSNFQANALFVPIMYRIAANSQQNIDPLFYRMNRGEIRINHAGLPANSIISLKSEAIEFLPDQRLDGRSIEMLLPKESMSAGHYGIYNSDDLIKMIALNQNPIESDVAVATDIDLVSVFQGSDFNIVSGKSSGEIITKITNDYKGIELWRYFLGLALVFLFLEALMIRLL